MFFMKRNDKQEEIKKDFARRLKRQLIAVATAVALVLLTAAVYKRQDLFGQFQKNVMLYVQILLILAFINFTAFNWRCPSCKKYLGPELHKHVCRKCGARLR
jgi:cell division protein FtsW (lipid II flippase)